jgi:DNA-binding transcriptional LysR family regulator
MKSPRLHDWNDVRILLACARSGGFSGAADVLGMDQTTVSRRIAAMEAAIGRPLFHRRRSGATLTAAGEALLVRARAVGDSVADFEGALRGLVALAAPTVTIAASEGIVSYLLIPGLLGPRGAELPLYRDHLKGPVPGLVFEEPGRKADIAVLATNPGEAPPGSGSLKGRRIGRMRFDALASKAFLEDRPGIDDFDGLGAQPLIDIAIYRGIRGLDAWNGLVAGLEQGARLTVPTTSAVQRPLAGGAGVTLLPGYAPLYDDRLVVLDVAMPAMAVDLWLVAHEDALREPMVRNLYDTIAEMFVKSPWFATA